MRTRLITWVLSAGLLDQAHEQLKEAVYLYGRVCDDLEPEACYCHSLLAKVAFLQGKAAEVLLQSFIAALHIFVQFQYQYFGFHIRQLMQISQDFAIYVLNILWG